MREIKFRGKSYFEWHFGSLLEMEDGGYQIINNEEYDVDKTTIGQYTGLKDKNGKEIYEGDIVKHDKMPFYNKLLIVWNNDLARYVMKYSLTDSISFDSTDAICCEVIGNVYDNPELLEANNGNK